MNDRNYKFFQATDGFFTDYHWQLENLEVTMKAYNDFIKDNHDQKSWDIYYGNDIYGRGTYGGGRLNIYKAIEEIKKYPFSISLFGPGLWYEKQEGCADLNAFRINEDLFWRGRGLKLVGDSTGKTVDETQMASKEKMIKDWDL